MRTIYSLEVERKDLNVFEVSKKGTVIIDPNDFNKLGFAAKPWGLTAKPEKYGSQIYYNVQAIYKHSFSNGNVVMRTIIKLK